MDGGGGREVLVCQREGRCVRGVEESAQQVSDGPDDKLTESPVAKRRKGRISQEGDEASSVELKGFFQCWRETDEARARLSVPRGAQRGTRSVLFDRGVRQQDSDEKRG